MNQKYNNFGININTYNLLFNESKEYKLERSKEIFTIEKSSHFPRKIFRNELLEISLIWMIKLSDMLYYRINYFNISKNLLKKGYTYNDGNIKFEFDYLKKYLRKILKSEDSYVKREILSDIRYGLRYGCCFSHNMVLSRNIENSYFVTGLVEYEDGSSHLHSYVEYDNYVLDFTKNLIIEKDVYYNLLRIKELQKIKSVDIDQMFNLLSENRILSTVRYIATFGNEIIKDLEKNKELLKIPEPSTRAHFDRMFF